LVVTFCISNYAHVFNRHPELRSVFPPPHPQATLTGGTRAQFEEIVTPGTRLGEACLADVDVIAAQSRDIGEAGAAVIFRPYHEMGGGWFWWGAKHPDSFRQIWHHLRDRLITFHGLDSLLWCWSAMKLTQNPLMGCQLRLTTLLFVLSAILSSASAKDEEASNYFGHQTKQESALIGILYDFKQTQKREPLKVSASKILAEFIDNGWDEGVLHQFYRVTQPLYATQIFIPGMNATEAPKAFGVADLVEPREWIVHYKGQVSAPEAGTYRFVGQADDWLAVAVNGKTVLVGCHPGSKIPSKWKPQSEGRTDSPLSGKLPVGDWFEVAEGEIIDLDIIIGENPGGGFAAWLLIEKKDQKYEVRSEGGMRLPIFQVAPFQTKFQGRTPAYSFPEPRWKAHQ
jgi:hypothetical protein